MLTRGTLNGDTFTLWDKNVIWEIYYLYITNFIFANNTVDKI